jgi:hypothetical protein
MNRSEWENITAHRDVDTKPIVDQILARLATITPVDSNLTFLESGTEERVLVRFDMKHRIGDGYVVIEHEWAPSHQKRGLFRLRVLDLKDNEVLTPMLNTGQRKQVASICIDWFWNWLLDQPMDSIDTRTEAEHQAIALLRL